MPIRGSIEINELYCKGCELCVTACPKGVIRLDMDYLTSKGYHPAQLVSDNCTGCVICAIVCPEAAITVTRNSISTRRLQRNELAAVGT
jgi:2-oxoglutarate ferredoxin oxidoreductase subunit delta